MTNRLDNTIGRIALALLLPIWPLAVHAEEYKGPIWGGGGGSFSYNLDCGSTGVLVGLYGKTGQWIDQLGITCQKVNANGTLGEEYTRGPIGGTGGAGKTSRCKAGSAISGMASSTGSFIDKLIAVCCTWSATTRRVDPDPRKCTGAEIGEYGVLGIFTLVRNALVTCPAGKVGKALRGKHGNYIDSLQFVCDEYNK